MAAEMKLMASRVAMSANSEPGEAADSSANLLYITNLDKRVSQEMIHKILKTGLPGCYDSIISVKVDDSTDPCSCFIQFRDNWAANQGMQFINGREFFEKKVKVSWAMENPAGGAPKIIGSSVSIYAGDLDDDIDDNALKKCFEACGEVLSAKIVKEPSTGQSKGFGFITFTSKQDAENAIQTMNGVLLGKKRIKTNWASRNKSNAPTVNTLKYEDVVKAASQENCTVYAGNIPCNANPVLVKGVFSRYGNVVDTRIFVDKGFAFIKFSDHESAANAITKAHGEHMCGAFLKCWWGKEEGSEQQPFRNNSGNNQIFSNQQTFTQPEFTPINQTTAEEIKANLQPMFQAAHMMPAQQEVMIAYCLANPPYYQECMNKWVSFQMQCAAMTAMNAQAMNAQAMNPALYYQQMQQYGQPQMQQDQSQMPQAQMQMPQGQPHMPQGQQQMPQGQSQMHQQLPNMHQPGGYQHNFQTG